MSESRDLRTRIPRTRRRRGGGLPWWAWLLVFGIPGLFFVGGIWFVIDAAIFASDAESTRGEVIGIETSYDSEGSVSYTPMFRYRQANGQLYEAGTHIASSEYDYGIGERVEILYARDDPGAVRINSFFSLYGAGLMFAGVGGLFISVLMFVRRSMLRHDARVSGQMERASPGKGQAGAAAHGELWHDPEPVTTDPSKYGHVHKPKPKRAPTVRRMR